jgi:hypothetical protein
MIEADGQGRVAVDLPRHMGLMPMSFSMCLIAYRYGGYVEKI